MKVIVIGGGAAGSLAAYFSAKNGNEVTLIEKNEKIGKKLYITGKGRCNLTNDCDEEEFLKNVVTNSRFLTGSIYGFSPKDTFSLFESEGLKLKTERGNRVFPLSDKSSDVIKTILKMLGEEGVTVKLNETVLAVLSENGKVIGVKTDKGEYSADKVIIACGGISYPSTGSTGDGYKFAKTLGHTVVSPVPSLCGINLKGDDFKALQGLTLKNVKLSAYCEDKKYYEEQGEILFTHYGVSGPLILTLSAYSARKNYNKVKLFIDLKPALEDKELSRRILRDFGENLNRAIKNSLDNLLPKALISLVIERSGICPDKKCNSVTAAERESLVKTLKNLEFIPCSARDFNEAVITSGGVSVKEINPSTMESKIVKGLFFAGEVIDIDALTGGFNLQIAFSTAYSAGKNK